MKTFVIELVRHPMSLFILSASACAATEFAVCMADRIRYRKLNKLGKKQTVSFQGRFFKQRLSDE